MEPEGAQRYGHIGQEAQRSAVMLLDRSGAGAREEIRVGEAQLGAQSAAAVHPVRPNCLKILVRPARLERATSWFVARRSIQLSYARRETPIIPCSTAFGSIPHHDRSVIATDCRTRV